MDNPGKSRPFESLYQKYDAWYDKEPGRSLFGIEVLALQKALEGLSGRVIEVGVGSGRFAEALHVRFGLDSAIKPLGLAKKRGILCVGGDGEALPFQADTFDVCLLVVTLCFVRNPKAVLKEAFRVLRTGGSVILGLVLLESPWGKAYRKLGEEGHPFYSLATFYTRGMIDATLKELGFSSIETFSTLFQSPGKALYEPELPVEGDDPKAGFTVIRAVKSAG